MNIYSFMAINPLTTINPSYPKMSISNHQLPRDRPQPCEVHLWVEDDHRIWMIPRWLLLGTPGSTTAGGGTSWWTFMVAGHSWVAHVQVTVYLHFLLSDTRSEWENLHMFFRIFPLQTKQWFCNEWLCVIFSTSKHKQFAQESPHIN